MNVERMYSFTRYIGGVMYVVCDVHCD